MPKPDKHELAYENAVRVLKRNGLTVEQARKMTDVELLSLPKFGWGRLRDFRGFKSKPCPSCGRPTVEAVDAG